MPVPTLSTRYLGTISMAKMYDGRPKNSLLNPISANPINKPLQVGENMLNNIEVTTIRPPTSMVYFLPFVSIRNPIIDAPNIILKL